MSEQEQRPLLMCVTGMQRTGTTWITRLLADCYGVPSLTRDWTWDDVECIEIDPVIHGLDRPGPAIRRGHWSLRQYPYPETPVILTVRDPRDEVLSSYYYHKQTDLDAHARWLISQAPRGRSWNDFIIEWQMHGTPVVRYEDLHADPYRTVRRIVEELDLPALTDEAINAAIHYNTFSVMVAEGRFHSQMRHGLVGEWKLVMDPRTAAHIVRFCGPLMQRLGYET